MSNSWSFINLSDFNKTIGGKKNKTKIKREKRHIASASTALLFGVILGLIQAVVLVFAAKPLLNVMGVKDVSVFILSTNHNSVQF